MNEKWPRAPVGGFRENFYTGSKLLQLMENVYLDMRLDETWDHPDNAGWNALFRAWARSKIVQDAWRLSKDTYGTRFRYFCARELRLD